jgi:hypothetical protein
MVHPSRLVAAWATSPTLDLADAVDLAGNPAAGARLLAAAAASPAAERLELPRPWMLVDVTAGAPAAQRYVDLVQLDWARLLADEDAATAGQQPQPLCMRMAAELMQSKSLPAAFEPALVLALQSCITSVIAAIAAGDFETLLDSARPTVPGLTLGLQPAARPVHALILTRPKPTIAATEVSTSDAAPSPAVTSSLGIPLSPIAASSKEELS